MRPGRSLLLPGGLVLLLGGLSASLLGSIAYCSRVADRSIYREALAGIELGMGAEAARERLERAGCRVLVAERERTVVECIPRVEGVCRRAIVMVEVAELEHPGGGVQALELHDMTGYPWTFP